MSNEIRTGKYPQEVIILLAQHGLDNDEPCLRAFSEAYNQGVTPENIATLVLNWVLHCQSAVGGGGDNLASTQQPNFRHKLTLGEEIVFDDVLENSVLDIVRKGR